MKALQSVPYCFPCASIEGFILGNEAGIDPEHRSFGDRPVPKRGGELQTLWVHMISYLRLLKTTRF